MRDHDAKRWGPLRAAIDGRPRLVRVLALIDEVARADDRARPDAAGIVVSRLAAAQLFMLHAAGDAIAVSESDQLNRIWPTGHGPIISFWEQQPTPSDFFHGPAGALEWMRKFWVEDADLAADWDDYIGAPLAILESAAIALFPELFGAPASGGAGSGGTALHVGEIAGDVGTPANPTHQVLPDGCVWPHIDGQPWTDAERVAMFKMRHMGKLSGEAIARIVGVTRQRIDEQIGPAKLVGDWRAKLSWQPSAELLKECGLPLQPLQSVAQAAA